MNCTHPYLRNPMDHIFVSPFLTTFQRVQKRLQKAHRYFRLCFILLCSCWCWSSLECRQLRKEWWLPCRWSRSRWSSSSTAGTLPLSRSLASFDLSTLVSLLLCWKNNVLVNMFLNQSNHCAMAYLHFSDQPKMMVVPFDTSILCIMPRYLLFRAGISMHGTSR